MAYCYICERDSCSNPEHESPVFVLISPELASRLEEVPFRRLDWVGYHIAPQSYGKLPVLFQFSPQSLPLTGVGDRVWWVKTTEARRGGNLHQLFIRLVEVKNAPGLTKILMLYENTSPLSPLERVEVSLKGRSERGYFLLTTAKSAESVSHTTVAEAVLKIELPPDIGWANSKLAGVVRHLPSPAISIYDHRVEPHDDIARVVVGLGYTTTRTWTYLHFYPAPANTSPLGRFVVTNAPQSPVIDYDREGVVWVGQSPHHWMFFVLWNEKTDLPSMADAVAGVNAAASYPDLPQLLLDALEECLLAKVSSSTNVPTDIQLEERWEKYKKIRARAERTSFINEAATSYKLAIFTLARMCGYERGTFDEYVEQMVEILTNTETTETVEDK